MSRGTSPDKVSISNIRSKLMRPSLTSHYVCNFELPPALQSKDSFIDKRVSSIGPTKLYDKLTLACSEASLPGSSLATHEINNDYHGVSEKHAYRRLYDDRADFSFYVDAEEYYVINFFESWIGYTMNEQYSSSRGYTYRAQYPDKYCSDSLSITKFERDYQVGEQIGLRKIPQRIVNGRTLQYNFVKAFPISISSMPVSYEASQLLKCTVAFTYSRYWIKNLVKPSESSPPTSSTSSVVP